MTRKDLALYIAKHELVMTPSLQNQSKTIDKKSFGTNVKQDIAYAIIMRYSITYPTNKLMFINVSKKLE